MDSSASNQTSVRGGGAAGEKTLAKKLVAHGVSTITHIDTGSAEVPLTPPLRFSYSNDEERHLAARYRAERQRRKAEAWAKRQPKEAP